MAAYEALRGLEAVYLEDSWVLDVTAVPGVVTFTLDLVLCPEHPRYRPARPGEQHCYASGRLIFRDVRSLSWESSSGAPAIDAAGETDHGSIDDWQILDGGHRLTGDFGVMTIMAGSPEVVFDEA